ncbi:hypothetical protein Tco_0418896 [Tanacetum coccineum]
MNDYVPGPEEPEHAPLSPDYVLGPEHADDEIIAEDQPGAEDASPTAQSPDYVPETDSERTDDMDIDSNEEDEDDEMDVEVDEEAEEENPAPAYPVVVALPAKCLCLLEETVPFIDLDESAGPLPPTHPAYHMRARITILEPVHCTCMVYYEVARLLAISSPPASNTISHGFITTPDSFPTATPDTISPYYHITPSPVLSAPLPVLFGIAWTQRDYVGIWIRIRGMRLFGPYREAPFITDTEVECERREEMRELRAADRTPQQQIIQTLTVMQTLQREMILLQGLVTILKGQGQQGPAGGPTQPELPEEAGSSS